MLNCAGQRALPQRLRKRVAEGLRCSLQQVDEHWRAGLVHVLTPGCATPQLVALETLVFEDDRVLFEGEALPPAAPPSYALLNKPKYVTCTARDPRGKSDLAPYLARMPVGCSPWAGSTVRRPGSYCSRRTVS